MNSSKHAFKHALSITLALLAAGCARSKMQQSAAQVAGEVEQLRADVEVQQLIRTEYARSGAERIARSEAELATREASRAAERPQLDESLEPLLDHSKAVSEGADPRYAPSLADEVERRMTAVEYARAVDELEALVALLERLAEGSRAADIAVYLELGAAAAEAAKTTWTETLED